MRIIETLKRMGLNGYEARIYFHLAVYGPMKAKDISLRAEVPITAVYPNMKTLENKKLISVENKDPLTVKAINPDIGLKSFTEIEKKKKDSFRNEILKGFKTIKVDRKVPEKEESFEMFRGWEQSVGLRKKLLEESESEFLLMSGLTKKTCMAIIHPIKNALKRGIKIKLITVRLTEENKNMLKGFQKAGASVRHYPMENFAIEVKDSSESVIVMRNPGLHDRIVLYMKNKDLAKAHRDYFLSVWKRGGTI